MARKEPDTPTVARFYQLGATPLEQAMARILAKAWEKGLRICLIAADPAQAQRLDDFLWIHPSAGGFLPHGLAHAPRARHHPVLIATSPEEENGATVAVVLGDRPLERPQQYDMVVAFVDGAEENALRRSREHYRHYRAQGCSMEYWIQGDTGWTRKE